MKPKSKKVISLLAALICAVSILCQPFGNVFAAGSDTNGWVAAKNAGEATDWTNKVELKALGEDITEIHTTYFKYGGAVNRNGLKPIKQGKFSIDVDFDLQKTNVTNWGSIFISIVWDCYCDGNPDVSSPNNGLNINLGTGASYATGWKIALHNNETNADFHFGEWDKETTDIDLSKPLHIVIETIGGNTNVYINDKLYGTTQFTEASSGYLWNGAKPTIAIGGGASWTGDELGEVYAVIDTHAPEATEKLQALIDACNAMENDNAPADAESAFRAAVEKAKTCVNAAENVALAAIDELTAAKEAYDASDKAPEYAALVKEIAACEKLANNTETADTPDYNQTTPAAKKAFTDAIDAAKAKLDGTPEEMAAALAELKTAKKTFSDSILHDTGWRAEWLGDPSQAEDKRDEVEIKYIDDGVTELLVGDHWTSGAELPWKFKPTKIGKWEFDFKVLPNGTTSNWFNIAWAWDVYNANEFTSAGVTTNGLMFQLNQLATSPKLAVYNVDAQLECSPDQQWEDLAVNETYHVVWETVRVDSDEPLFNDDTWEPYKFETTIYVNDRVYGSFYTGNQNYYWRDDTAMSMGVGGDGQTRLVIDITPETNEEKLSALIERCKAYLEADGDSVAAAALRLAITAAEEALDKTEDVLILAIDSLEEAEKIYVDSTARVSTYVLRQAIADAEGTLNVLAEETSAYGKLDALIKEAKALIEEDTADQSAYDAKVEELIEADAKAREENIVFDVNKLDKFDPTGLTLKSNGKFVSFATAANKPGKLYSENWFDISTVLDPANKLVFNITDLDRIEGQYSRMNFIGLDGELEFYVEIVKIDGDGVIRVCLPPELETDPTTFVPLAVTNYTQGEDVQVALEVTENGIRISIDGKIMYEEENGSISDIFNGEDVIFLSLTTGGEQLGAQKMTLDFDAEEIPPTPYDPSEDPDYPDPSNPWDPNYEDPNLPATGDVTNIFLTALALTSGITVVLLKKRCRSPKA